MTDFLEQVIAERRAYVVEARERASEGALLERAKDNLWSYRGRERISFGGWAGASANLHDAFSAALRGARRSGHLAVIAEVKRVSPALGTLAADLDPGRQARRYASAGATAISVLTEPNHWGGSLRDLVAVRDAVDQLVPVLAKDVVVSDYQIVEARSAGADAVLLIAEALTDQELRRSVERARDLGMGVLVEAHEPAAFGRAVACGAAVVGVNARDLRRPRDIDPGRVRQLHTFARQDQVLVAESGIESVDDARLLPARVDAVLVGTALMRADDPAPLIRQLAGIKRTPPTTSAVVIER